EDGHQERPVSWQIGRKPAEFIFTGGIIMVANRPLDNVPELRALATRIANIHYQATNEEVAALMRKIASNGRKFGEYQLSPEECAEVASRMRRLERNLDLRLFVNACQD